LQLHLGQYDAQARQLWQSSRRYFAAINRMNEEAKAGRASFCSLISRLSGIPGVSTSLEQTILADITTDMTRLAPAAHLVAWAGLCPGQNGSVGKRKSLRLQTSATWRRNTLSSSQPSPSKKDSYFKAQFQRLKSRRGPQTAICAVAASMLATIYHMLKDGTQFLDLGADRFDRRPPRSRQGISLPASLTGVV
jgi:transposase